MLSSILEDPGQVIVRLTGHIDLVRPEHICGERPAGCLVAAAGFMVNPRDPLRRRFDKPPPQLREETRQFTHEQHVAGDHCRTTEHLERIFPVHFEERRTIWQCTTVIWKSIP